MAPLRCVLHRPTLAQRDAAGGAIHTINGEQWLTIQGFRIFPDRSRSLLRIDGRRIPPSLGAGVQLVHVSHPSGDLARPCRAMDRARVDGEPFASSQAFFDAASHALEDQPEQVAVAELGPCRYFENVE